MDDLPLILVEVVMVFGGVLLFAWWQFRDLARERRLRATRSSSTPAPTEDDRATPADDVDTRP